MANVYSPTQLGIKAPAGGFLTGGWYSGRQYWNGTLSEPGQIHPQSSQVGAGQPVSKEVIAQTAPQNVAYIQQQQAQAAAKPVVPAAIIAPTAPTPTTTPTPTGVSGVAGAGVGAITTPETINLPKLYESLYASSGIRDLEAQLSTKEKEYTEAKGKINDNPFLSEATRVGRIAKIEQLYSERTANLRSDIATKKADVETQLNLQTKQFDINSQVAQQALSQFNTLLSAGALDNASGEDIANLTRATGISSAMIYSAIAANKAKNVKSQVITSTNDAGVVTVTVINPDTGEIIKQTSLGAIGNVQGGGAGSATKNIQAQFTEEAKTIQGQQTSAGWVGEFPLLVAKYAPFMSLEDIYKMYMQSALGKKYGAPAESAQEIREIYDTYRGA